jgi:plasmid maintenance system antidote protein VapI
MVEETVVNIEFDPQSLETMLDEQNLSQAEFARLAGYPHRNIVNKIIKGNREATATDLLRFSEVLNKSPKDFAKIA